MQHYGFQPEFIDPITSRAKWLTLRQPRNGRARHAEIGEGVACWVHRRTPNARRFAVGLCIVRATLHFDRLGITKVTDKRVHGAMEGDIARLEEALTQAHRVDRFAHDFARLDGFENWASAWGWHEAHRTEAERKNDDGLKRPLIRELIAWRLIENEDAIAHLERHGAIEPADAA